MSFNFILFHSTSSASVFIESPAQAGLIIVSNGNCGGYCPGSIGVSEVNGDRSRQHRDIQRSARSECVLRVVIRV